MIYSHQTRKAAAFALALSLSLITQSAKTEQVQSETNRFDGTQKVTYTASKGECKRIKGRNTVERCHLLAVNMNGLRGVSIYFLTTTSRWNLLYFKKIHWIGTLSDGTTIKGYGNDIETRVMEGGGVLEMPWFMVNEGEPNWNKIKELEKIEIGIGGEEYEWKLNKTNLLKALSMLK